jgi:dihydroorotate dehydrogenase
VLNLAYRLLRPLLFALDAERAHDLVLRLLAAAPRLWARLAAASLGPPPAALARPVAGLPFAGPVGLAAGLDKDGVAVPVWPALGFGFVEVGTVTALAQEGNPRPRLFRLPAEGALVNRMGFNNRGSAELARRLGALKAAGRWPAVPVGGNVGKSRATPLAEAAADYALSVGRLAGLADYFTVNVSSPNTPGLRQLQEADSLARLLPAVVAAAAGVPVFLKLDPDLAPEALAAAVELAVGEGVAGIVAANTTVGRPGLARDPGVDGGLSGRPLWPLARRAIAAALDAAGGRVPVIGVGGIETAAQVAELLAAGCAAVQIYTALIYQGPGLVARLNRQLADGSPPPRSTEGSGAGGAG